MSSGPAANRAAYNTQITAARWGAGQIRYTARALALHRNYREPMEPNQITRLIEAGFSDADVRVASDDNAHFEALVVMAEFEGLGPLQRHQLVYKTLGTLMGNEIRIVDPRDDTGQYRQQAG